MKERPILFSGPMVRALLAGTKTQTRRTMRKQFCHDAEPEEMCATNEAGHQASGHFGLWWDAVRGDPGAAARCPYGKPGDGWREAPRGEVHGRGAGAHPLGHQQGIVQPAVRSACSGCGAVVDSGHRIGGDRLWVRETWGYHPDYPESARRVCYRADIGHEHDGIRWRPSIHMPRAASRITLEITEVRVERLQEISEADAVAEGCARLPLQDGPGAWWSADVDAGPALHGRTARDAYRLLWESINGPGSWGENPWVWVIAFKVCS